MFTMDFHRRLTTVGAERWACQLRTAPELYGWHAGGLLQHARRLSAGCFTDLMVINMGISMVNIVIIVRY